ncbi:MULTISPECIES: cytochrome c-type biogenesis protein CcmH [unclassified Modestobacter]
MSGRLRILAVVLAVVALVAALWWRQDTIDRADPAATAREVAAGLRCPTCAGESAADSAAPAARAMRAVIAERAAAGEGPDEIRGYFVERYGEWILLDPPRRGVGWALVVLPGVALLGGALAVGVLVARRRPAGRPSLTDAERGRAEAAVAAARERPGGLTGSGDEERLEAALQLLDDVRSDPGRTAPAPGIEDELLAEILRLSSARPEGTPATTTGDPGGASTPTATRAGPAARGPRPAVVVPVVVVAAACVVALVAVPRALESPGARAGDAAAAQSATAAGGAGGSEAADELLRQARALDDAGRFAEAVTAYRAVLEERPQDPGVVLALGFALVRDDRPAEAVPLLESVLADAPEHPEALLILGTAEHALGDDRAGTTLRRFLELAPDHPAAAAVRTLLDVP